MKIAIKAIILLILVVNFGCAPNFCKSNEAECFGKLVGTYYGAASTGDLRPTLTSFYLDENSNLKGKYFINFREFNNDRKSGYEGEFLDVKPVAEYMMQASWKDNAGKGPLRLVFKTDGREFAGYWAPRESARSYGWHGKKVSDKPTVTLKDLSQIIETLPDSAWPEWPWTGPLESSEY